MSELPRRRDMLRWTRAEHAVHRAIRAVELTGADLRLTDAVLLLQAALDSVADYVDGVESRRSAVDFDRLAALELELAEARTQLAIETRAALDCNDALAKERAALSAEREANTANITELHRASADMTTLTELLADIRVDVVGNRGAWEAMPVYSDAAAKARRDHLAACDDRLRRVDAELARREP